MSLVGHYGGLQIGKAERPGPSLGKINRDQKSKSEKPSSSRGFSQVIGGMLHSQRRDEAPADDRSDTASLSSIATEKRALLASSSLASSKSKAPKLADVNETRMPPMKYWS